MNRKDRVRWIWVVAVLAVAMAALIWKLYDLTITNGSYYRDISDTKRVKEIELTAPRGNIYDRNGVLLAGTRSSYAVQAYKDEINALDATERNDVLQKLVRYIEVDGVDYVEDFPLEIYPFTYQSDSDYFTESESPTDYVIRMLLENNLVGEWVKLYYRAVEADDYQVSIASRALTAMSLKGAPLPIDVDASNGFALKFRAGAAYDELLQSGAVQPETSASDYLAQVIHDDKSLMQRILTHPAARVITYELLASKNLTGKVINPKAMYAADLNWVGNKASLNRRFPNITLTTNAKDDFVEIVMERSLETFLTSVSVDDNNNFVIPAERLINQLDSLGVKSNLSYEIDESGDTVTIVFETPEQTMDTPIARLISLGKQYDLLKPLITDDALKSIAENANFKEGVYPRISTATWEYGYVKDKADFVARYQPKTEDPGDALTAMEDYYGLDTKSNIIEAQGVISLIKRISEQGNYAYAPINICYEISQQTVARIEENIPTSKGVAVSVEPIRTYPYGTVAAHILGYIGKISSDAEIQKYVVENGYNPNQMIGKTGVEESFEDTLRGISGKQTVLIDSFGNRTDTISEIAPKPGNNLYLSIDINAQVTSEKALAKSLTALQKGEPYVSDWGTTNFQPYPFATSGATVSLDPNTGELLAMASYPSYDPNLFVTGISNSDWEDLIPEDEEDPMAPRPLINIATQTAVQPGSTFKMLTSMAAIQKGIDPKTRIVDRGVMHIGDEDFACWLWNRNHGTHGAVNMSEAIQHSCNYYFYVLGLGFDPEGPNDPGGVVTVDDIEHMAHLFGLDQPTGIEINVPREVSGTIPSTSGKLAVSRTILRKYLEQNLLNYKEPDFFKNSNDVKADIDQILTWLEEGRAKTRQSVINDLTDMHYIAETPLEGQYTGLADIIKYTYLNQVDWTQSDSLNMVIGQGQNAYTPIEIANYVATIVNNGGKHKVTVVKEIRSHDDKTVVYRQEPSVEQLQVEAIKHLDAIKEGMRLSAQSDVAGRLYSALPFKVASKTGTAQRGGTNPLTGKDFDEFSWYIAYAPFEDPKIVTVTLQMQAGAGNNSVPMTAEIMAEYLGAEKPGADE